MSSHSSLFADLPLMFPFSASLGFLKDANSLAELNVGDGAVLEMTLKSRGGKR